MARAKSTAPRKPRVKKGPQHDNHCWHWQASINEAKLAAQMQHDAHCVARVLHKMRAVQEAAALMAGIGADLESVAKRGPGGVSFTKGLILAAEIDAFSRPELRAFPDWDAWEACFKPDYCADGAVL